MPILTRVYIHMDCLAAMLLHESDPGVSTEAQDKVYVCLRCLPLQEEARKRRPLLMDIIEGSKGARGI